MAIHYRSQGLVLKKIDRGETDQFFVIYTEDFGKLEILGKAIRKIKSKLRSGIELFYLSDIEFIQGKNYKTLTDAIAIEKFKNIRKDLDKLEIAQRITETLDDLVKGEEKDEKIWDLLNEVFNRLSLSREISLVYYYFFWNLVSILGYQIDLFNCAICRKKLLPEKNYFSPEQGITCGNCSKQGKEISSEVIKILRLFLQKDWQTIRKLKITDFHKKALESTSEFVIINL